MKENELGALLNGIVPAVKEYIVPVAARVDEIEALVKALPVARDGKDGIDGKDGANGHDAQPVHPDTVARLVHEAVAKEVAAIPKPKDGESVDIPELLGQISTAAKSAVLALPIPKDGRDYDPEILKFEIQRAVDAIPKPADGLHGTDGKDGRDGVDGKNGIDGKDGVDGINGKDGEDGRDGLDGRDGNDVDVDVMRAEILRAVDALPRPQDGKNGIDGKDAVPVDVQKIISEILVAIPTPKDGIDGKDVDPEFIKQEIAKAVDALPAPKDGKDGLDGKDGITPHPDTIKRLVSTEVKQAISEIPLPGPGPAGKDADPAEITRQVDSAIKAIPIPRDGKDADADAITAAILDRVIKTLPEAPKDGRDGIDGKSVSVDDLRPILEGEFAKWALEFERRAVDVMQRAIDRMPAAKDGTPGRDGTDGQNGRDAFALKDFRASMKDGRTLVLTMEAGDEQITHELPIEGMPIERGVYRSGQPYKSGDGVTYGSSYWIAQQDTDESPTGPSHHWRLAVKGTR